jgi:hypothetical protein
MRKQYCREHIRKVAVECGLGDDIVAEVEKVDKFCGSNPAFADCATRPVYRLISEKDIEVRNRAISFAQNALMEETPTGGRVRTSLIESDMITFIRRARRELHKEPEEKKPAKIKTSLKGKILPEKLEEKPGYAGNYQPGEVKVSDAPAIQGLKIEPDVLPVITDNSPILSPKSDTPLLDGKGRFVRASGAPSPFKTAAEVKAHREDPLKVGEMFQQAAIKDIVKFDTMDQDKFEREEVDRTAEEFLQALYKKYPRYKMMVDEALRYHSPSWKAKDLLCYGIEAISTGKVPQSAVMGKR